MDSFSCKSLKDVSLETSWIKNLLEYGTSAILVNKSIFLSISLISSLFLTKSFLYVSLMLNSSSLKILVISLLLSAFNFKSSSSNSTGTFVIIVANFLIKNQALYYLQFFLLISF